MNANKEERSEVFTQILEEQRIMIKSEIKSLQKELDAIMTLKKVSDKPKQGEELPRFRKREFHTMKPEALLNLKYNADWGQEDKVLYALTLIKTGTVREVAEQVLYLDPEIGNYRIYRMCACYLSGLRGLGAINSKIIRGENNRKYSEYSIKTSSK